MHYHMTIQVLRDSVCHLKMMHRDSILCNQLSVATVVLNFVLFSLSRVF